MSDATMSFLEMFEDVVVTQDVDNFAVERILLPPGWYNIYIKNCKMEGGSSDKMLANARDRISGGQSNQWSKLTANPTGVSNFEAAASAYFMYKFEVEVKSEEAQELLDRDVVIRTFTIMVSMDWNYDESSDMFRPAGLNPKENISLARLAKLVEANTLSPDNFLGADVSAKMEQGTYKGEPTEDWGKSFGPVIDEE